MNTDHATITAATTADAAELANLVNSAYRGDSSRQGWTTEADLLGGTRVDETIVHNLLTTPNTVVLKYMEGNETLGCVELRVEARGLYLGMLSVRPNLQAKGFGKKLLFAAEAYAQQQACTKIFMLVISARHDLIAWYIRHGYQLTGERKPFVVPDKRFGIPKQALEFVVLEKAINTM